MSDRPIVLLHGWGGSFDAIFRATGWVDAITAENRTVLDLDLPGHGSGPASHIPADYADLAGDVLARIDRRASGPVDIVGYSLGAKLAVEIACRAPARFERIVLGGVGDNIFAPERDGTDVALALEDGLADDAPPSIAALVHYSRRNGGDPRGHSAVLRRPPNPVASAARMATIGAPVLLVNGDQDGLAQPDGALVGALPRIDHLILEGVDHFALPSAAAFRDAALEYLRGSAVRAASSPGGR